MGDISSEPGGRGITVTIKYGRDYDEPWVVFRGNAAEVREDIEATFGPGDKDLSLAQLILNVSGEALAMKVASTKLGAVAIGKSASVAQGDAPANEGSPWSGLGDGETKGDDGPPWDEPAASATPEQRIAEAITKAMTVEALGDIWAADKAVINGSADLLGAFTERGKALTAAAA